MAQLLPAILCLVALAGCATPAHLPVDPLQAPASPEVAAAPAQQDPA